MKKILIYILIIFSENIYSQTKLFTDGNGHALRFTGGSMSINISAPPVAAETNQIIANHTIVDDYAIIPQTYIDSVKKMWVVFAGRSHAWGPRAGLGYLEAIESKFQVETINDGTPATYTDQYLRFNGATWGDFDTPTGWIHEYYFWDWYTTPAGIAQTKAGLTYCNTNRPDLSVFGYSFCYDEVYDMEDVTTNVNAYLAAMTGYFAYLADSIPTRIYYSTAAVDGNNASGSQGYYSYLRNELIRDHVNSDTTLILFDYADILCHEDDGTMNTAEWDGHTYPTMADVGAAGASGHITVPGSIKLAKAMWWMLARIAGWDGN